MKTKFDHEPSYEEAKELVANLEMVEMASNYNRTKKLYFSRVLGNHIANSIKRIPGVVDDENEFYAHFRNYISGTFQFLDEKVKEYGFTDNSYYPFWDHDVKLLIGAVITFDVGKCTYELLQITGSMDQIIEGPDGKKQVSMK